MPHPPSQGYGLASIQRRKRQNRIFLFLRLDDNKHRMSGFPPEEVTPFVFSDPTGKRWPRLRLVLLIGGVLFFLGTVLFVQTLFVAPHMNVPFSLRQLKGQLKALQKKNPAGQLSPGSLLWQKFSAARLARCIQGVLAALRSAKSAGVVIDSQQIDPAYKKDLTKFNDKFTDALHDDNKELWLCVQPGQELDYIDFDVLADNIDRFVAMLFDETSDVDPPGPLASRSWFEGWLHVLLEDSDHKPWIIALDSYGYDWTIRRKKRELISF